MTQFGRYGVVLALAVLAFVFVVRPFMRRALPGPADGRAGRHSSR